MKTNFLNVTLLSGEVVNVPTQSYVVQVWLSGQWKNLAAFIPNDWEKAEEAERVASEKYKNVRLSKLY